MEWKLLGDEMGILKYTDYYGKRFAWKIGDLNREEPYGRSPGQFAAGIDISIDNHAFYDESDDSYPLSHEFHAVFWRWGIWLAIRGRKV